MNNAEIICVAKPYKSTECTYYPCEEASLKDLHFKTKI